MKRLVFVFALAVVLSTSGTAFALSGENFGGALKVGVDFAGNWDVDNFMGGADFDTDTSFSIGAEGYYLANEYFDVGAGIQYLFEREIDTSPGWKFWFLPIYGVVRVHPAMGNHTPYGIVQLGYSFHDGNSAYFAGGDVNGGFYWGLGGGYIYKRHFLAELLYSECRGEEDTVGIDITHRRVTFSVGYNF